ncbi:MAG: arsenate reductase ArsC [Tepidisphaeraceae bacterium]
MSDSIPNVLFLCTGNACRSQMAEGFARKLLAGHINAYSAGVEPHGMNPRAMKVMAEAGMPIDAHHSKHVNELVSAGVRFDYIVTVCGHADEACPMLPGPAKRIHRGFDDPPKLTPNARTEEEALAPYRRVRDEIRAYVEQRLMADLNGAK